jgi:hypothetical protein
MRLMLRGQADAARIKLSAYEFETNIIRVYSKLRMHCGADGVPLYKPFYIDGPSYKALPDATEVDYEKAREHAVAVLLRVWCALVNVQCTELAMPCLSPQLTLWDKYNVSRTVRSVVRALEEEARISEDACTLCDTREPANALMACNTHAFCFACISAWWRKMVSEGKKELTCPMCRCAGASVTDKTTGKEYCLPQWRLRALPRQTYTTRTSSASEEEEDE